MMTRHVKVRELARSLACSQETIRRLIREGKIPCKRVGREYRIDPEEAALVLSRGAASGSPR